MQPRRPKLALSYYLAMGLLLLLLLISLLRHFQIRSEQGLLIIALGAMILFAIYAAWRATHGGG